MIDVRVIIHNRESESDKEKIYNCGKKFNLNAPLINTSVKVLQKITSNVRKVVLDLENEIYIVYLHDIYFEFSFLSEYGDNVDFGYFIRLLSDNGWSVETIK